MFALSGFAGTWMQFLDASKSADIIPPWRPGWSIGTALVGGLGSFLKTTAVCVLFWGEMWQMGGWWLVVGGVGIWIYRRCFWKSRRRRCIFEKKVGTKNWSIGMLGFFLGTSRGTEKRQCMKIPWDPSISRGNTSLELTSGPLTWIRTIVALKIWWEIPGFRNLLPTPPFQKVGHLSHHRFCCREVFFYAAWGFTNVPLSFPGGMFWRKALRVPWRFWSLQGWIGYMSSSYSTLDGSEIRPPPVFGCESWNPSIYRIFLYIQPVGFLAGFLNHQ